MASHAEIARFSGGYIGVDIFFVLSGFLISSILTTEYISSSDIALRDFYLRRALRLMPALLLLLLVFFVASFFILEGYRRQYNQADIVIAALYMSNWARAFVRHPPDYLGSRHPFRSTGFITD